MRASLLTTTLAILTLSGAALARPEGAASRVSVADHFVFAPDFTPVFEYLTAADGLPDNSVRAIVQDRAGFLWFGTQNGLARYDGYEMRVFLPIPGDSTSLGERTIEALAEDGSGAIWIGTFLNGLWRFDPNTETFRSVRPTAGPARLGGGHVHDVCADSAGGIWAAMNEGLMRVDLDAGTAAWYPIDFPPGPNTEYPITAVLTDRSGNVWVGTEGGGVAVTNSNAGAPRFLGRMHALISPYVHDIFQTSDGSIVVATEEGLSIWNAVDSTFASYQPRPGAGAISENRLLRIAERDGVLFIGSVPGIYAFDITDKRFRLFAHDAKRAFSPASGPVLSMYCDRSGIIWAGSWYSALNKFDPSGARFRAVRRDPSDPRSTDFDPVMAIHADADGALWVATSDHARGGDRGALYSRLRPGDPFEGIRAQRAGGAPTVRCLLRGTDGTLHAGTHEGVWSVVDGRMMPSRLVRDATANVRAMAWDGQGNLWVGTRGGGLLRVRRATGETTVFRNDEADSTSVSEDVVIMVLVDRDGRVWAGTDARGLNLFVSDERGFKRFFDPEKGLDSIVDMLQTSSGDFWLATFAGLLRFDPERGVVAAYGRAQGLPNDQVVSLLADDQERVWLSTGNGFARFDPHTGSMTTYDRRDGLPSNEPNFARALAADGRMYFGGPSGLVTFRPEDFHENPFVPPVVLTRITVDDVEPAVGGDSPLQVPIHLAHRIELRHDQNDISISFAALDFARPERNRYTFRLEGDDERWREPLRRTATYTNLGPGEYVFRVRGSNRDGRWNDAGASLAIRILPPWWQTSWAYALYVAAVAFGVFAVYRQIVQRERMRGALAVEKAEAAHLHELDRLKSRFLTNISHELRTPLTLIKAPLSRLQTDPAGGDRPLFETMSRNADRLSQLIDQLLDLSRLEAGRLPVKWRRGDYAGFLRALVSSFDSLAEMRRIEIKTNFPAGGSEAWYDPDLIEKIVGNLLSNALKFTPEGGKVDVDVVVEAEVVSVRVPQTSREDELPRVEARKLVVSVANTGTYLPVSEQARIFDRFYQFGPAVGSGVGLALVKELTEWLGGQIAVTSDPERGTRFTVVLPVFLAPPTPESAIDEREFERVNPLPGSSLDEVEAASADGAMEAELPPLVLVVEDHPDLLGYLQKEMAPDFRVVGAQNGLVGFETATAEIPDLVLSDVMMPGMDGFELCKRLKEDERTSHIPVILLTARTEAESRRRGLETGADDYLAKPFDVGELKLRIRNLTTQRRKLAEQFARQVATLSPDAMPVSSADERFLLRAREVVEAHLDDPDFRMETFCREIAMSRAQLHRKLKAVTGRSAREFVRLHRLQRAAQLLTAGYGNVTEVAYAVGFRNLSYFAKSFREQFGSPPSDYPPRA